MVYLRFLQETVKNPVHPANPVKKKYRWNLLLFISFYELKAINHQINQLNQLNHLNQHTNTSTGTLLINRDPFSVTTKTLSTPAVNSF